MKWRLAKDKGSQNLPIDSNDENGKRRQNSAFGRHAATTSFEQPPISVRIFYRYYQKFAYTFNIISISVNLEY